MKVVIITDTHAGARNDNIYINEYILDFFKNQLFPYMKENNITKIIHGGDVFDRRKYLNINTLDTWIEEVFDYLERENIQMDVIIGNHDVYWKNTNKVNSVKTTLRCYNNIKLYEKAEEVNVGGLDILYVPWINQENYDHSIEKINNSNCEYLIGHLEIKGFQMHRGTVNTDHGFEPSVFNRYYSVMSGHFHHKSSEGHIHYLGSPYEMNWSDWGDRRGFHVLDTETREIEFIENERKIFLKIDYNDKDKTLEEVMDVDFGLYNSKYVKVVIEENTNPYFFDMFLEKINENNPIDVKIVGKLDDVNGDLVDEITTKDTLTILHEYIENVETEIDKKSLSDIMSDIYHEAINMDIE